MCLHNAAHSFACCSVGLAILAMPFAFSKAGFLGAAVVFGVAASVRIFFSNFVVDSGQNPHQHNNNNRQPHTQCIC